MTQTLVEILLLVPTALCAGFVIFVAGVIQGVMNDLDEAEFKRFLTLLKTRALRSPYAIGVSSIIGLEKALGARNILLDTPGMLAPYLY
jgi:hypothetical protein